VPPSLELERAAPLPDPLWRRLIAQPERAPELIALAAADRFAGPAEKWVGVAGVGQTPAGLAETAYRKHLRLSRVEGFALGFGGAATGAANLAGLAWIQARMVFFIAAAHGFDPRHPMRPAELLALWGIYDTPAQARESLDGMGKTMAQALVESRLAGAREARLSEKLLRFVGKRVAKRAAGRLVPVIGAPISAVQNGGSTKDLGQRALAFYGGSPPSGG
jgi:hypothetical protein